MDRPPDARANAQLSAISPPVNESRPPEEPVEPTSRNLSEQSPPVPQSHPPLPTALPSAESSEPREHAYWTEFEEDTTTPDEEELKEIETADTDYSACDYDYWEKNFLRELDDPEYQPGEKAHLTWKFKGVRGTRERPNRAKIMRSPAALVGGYWWRIKFYPRGNNVGSLSIYVECSPTLPRPDEELPETEFKVCCGPADAVLNDCDPDLNLQSAPTDDAAAWLQEYKSQYPAAAAATSMTASSPWRVSAQIGVIVYNPEEPRTGWMQSSCHQFNPHNLDWGWTYFHGPWDQIHLRRRGQHRALLCNDTLAFDAYIRVVHDPTQSLWWHPSDSEPTWDSLALTGYRPLGDSVVNHSAEVAGLASWLHIAPFCKIIQGADVLAHLTNCDIKPKPLCDALQKLLWQLRQRGKSLRYVDTDTITSTLRNLHEFSGDVTEFWERLRRTLELELEGTDASKQFARLFDSPSPDTLPANPHGAGIVNTLPSDFNSRVFVAADQVHSIREAVTEYLSVKQGRWSLPPVLHVELGRHTLDKGMRWQLLYNKVELNEELDLEPWVVDGQGKYILYGYIVHRGRRTSGKFFSILRPAGPGTRWLAFDDGSDNRVECLTQKTALGPHLGLDPSQSVDHKKGHDIPIVVMYVRRDMVSELLPGPQGPWEVPAALKQYYDNGVYPSTAEKSGNGDVQAEVYSLSQYDPLDSLFDTYDLMSQAKAANGVMYVTMPRSTPIVELRKKIATWKSTGPETIGPERVRLWQIGHTRAQFGPTLAFHRITDLNATLDCSLDTVRFWIETVSEADAKLFSMPDPPTATTSEDKPEESVFERDAASEAPPFVAEGDAAASSSSDAPSEVPTAPSESTSHDETLPHPVATASAESDAAAAERAENEAVLAAVAAHDQQVADPAGRIEQSANPSTSASSTSAAPNLRAFTPPPAPAELEKELPVSHAYYFVQIFDADKQVLRTVGSFFSQLETNVKASIRNHLQWPIQHDFLVWKRVDSTTVTTVSPAENFLDVVVPHGACIVVGDKLSKDKRSQLSAAGLFSSPDRLVQYLWAQSRRHPIQAFTGTKTVEASFTGEHYSGQFLKGYYHGRGKHIPGTGIVYDGDFVLGRRQGQGKMEYPTGDTYDGDWVEDVRHGQGTYIEKNTGNKYLGGFKDGKRHGKGITYWEVADDEMDLCQICYSEEQDAVFCDCGHVCACVTCAKQVDLCPICRKTIKSVIKIYRT